MKKIIVLESSGSNKNPAEVVTELFKNGKNVRVKSLDGNVSCTYLVGGQIDPVNDFISKIRNEGIKIISVKEVRNNTPVDADALLKIESRSIIPT